MCGASPGPRPWVLAESNKTQPLGLRLGQRIRITCGIPRIVPALGNDVLPEGGGGRVHCACRVRSATANATLVLLKLRGTPKLANHKIAKWKHQVSRWQPHRHIKGDASRTCCFAGHNCPRSVSGVGVGESRPNLIALAAPPFVCLAHLPIWKQRGHSDARCCQLCPSNSEARRFEGLFNVGFALFFFKVQSLRYPAPLRSHPDRHSRSLRLKFLVKTRAIPGLWCIWPLFAIVGMV